MLASPPSTGASVPAPPIPAASPTDSTQSPESSKVTELINQSRIQFHQMTTNYQRDLDKIVQATLASLDYMKPEAELKSAYTALFNYIAKSAAEEYGILEQRVETQFHSKFSTWMVDQAAYRRYFSKIYNPLMSEAQEIFEWASNRIENMKKALGNFIFERNEFRGL